jgi:hypothetical protein
MKAGKPSPRDKSILVPTGLRTESLGNNDDDHDRAIAVGRLP